MEMAMGKRLVPKFNDTEERDAFTLQVCQEFMASGLSKSIFCDKRKISYSSLYRWLNNFKGKLDFNQPNNQINLPQKENKAPTSKKPRVKHNFLRVNVEQQIPVQTNNLPLYPKPTLPSAELVFPNGLRLIINQVINTELLSHLLQATR